MKKTVALALASTMLIASFVGCGKSEEKSGTTKAGGENSIFSGELEENVTIQVLENDTAISKGYFSQLIDAFNKEYEKYGITAVDANMDQYLDLANDGPYGYGPDVLYQANDVIMQYAQGKHILPLPVEQLDCYSQVPEAAWDAYKVDVDGQTYTCGVPVNVQCPMMYYRKDLLPEDWKENWDKDGNDTPDMVENWNDMYKFSVARHSEDSNKYGYMKSLYDVYFSSGFLFSYGGYIFGDNNTNPENIGFAAGDSKKGAWVLSQLATAMNEDCIDDTITTNAYSKLADGTYFATLSTPDTYTTFYDELVGNYEEEGLSEEDAKAKADEKLVMTALPKLPESGDLSDENPSFIDSKMMGGVNGYAISSYTKSPNACLAFVDFATKYEMIMLRNETLGISPAREDVAKEVGGLSQEMFANLEKGNIVLMPSIKEVGQIWTPGQTFFTDLAKDAFRAETEKKYKDLDSLQTGLEDMSQQIHDAIFTLE
ncbi:arabinogalactan oligomer / maltooligosaccharide transport system substrate-binding protein [Pseudobutyrivibrio sp. YE44]|uniref:sugar ABC transporter substrate-binding protein n=1 Tax=Pseudobutyrivibrio sp. YE44 TaxID=1520802 RepID=UPI0008918FE8|nr:extracellular solute-binding protein [Pseudobutyrivibrio sp. YE44]SDB30999.1 arabinogalactan oligomer / maltooligosaccharide transport system substrate-binding protein [Pseudobutyrivibrio sp. YE44]